MKKISVALAFVVGLLTSQMVWAENYTVAGPGPAPIFLDNSSQDVYYHIGSLNFNVPWNNVNVVYLYDFVHHQNLVGGESVVASLWRLQATVGAVTSIEGRGAPFVGGNLWFTNPIPQIAVLSQIKPGIFGGYDWVRGSSIFGVKAAFPLFN